MGFGFGYQPLFRGTVLNTVTQYIPVPVRDGAIGVHFAWTTTTSNGTITLELTSFNATDAPVDETGDNWEWVDSGEVITGPDGVSTGATLINVENVRQMRARIAFVATADSQLEVYNGMNGL